VPTIYTVTEGFHLLVRPPNKVRRLVTFLQANLRIERIAPFHCTGEFAFKILMQRFKDRFDQARLGQSIALP
jgi:7,8-dihydropterin-6-yl-methyl-4-(beta-D-ribofuranosyl)aminobenzene 5'-phosphate synthase